MASRAKVQPSGLSPEQSDIVLERFRLGGQDRDLVDYIRRRVETKAKSRRKTAKKIGASAALLLFLLWAIPTIRSTSTTETLPAHRQNLTLADGSRAELNARTEFKTDFRYGRRLVRLNQGEVFLSVAKDAAHPFIVESPAGTVLVTGTKFNVRLGTEGQAVVTLLEGSVTVTPQRDPKSAHLIPGQAASFGHGQARVSNLSDAQLAAAVAWRRGQIVLDDLTMGEAAARVADFHGCAISVARDVSALRLGGNAPLDDLGQFFKVLQAYGKLKVTDLGGGRYQISGK